MVIGMMCFLFGGLAANRSEKTGWLLGGGLVLTAGGIVGVIGMVLAVTTGIEDREAAFKSWPDDLRQALDL